MLATACGLVRKAQSSNQTHHCGVGGSQEIESLFIFALDDKKARYERPAGVLKLWIYVRGGMRMKSTYIPGLQRRAVIE
jgi:hypothetical protein